MTIRKKISFLLIALVLISCATVDVGDTPKTVLYTLKQSWTEIRSYVMTQFVQDKISDAELADFKALDSQFTVYYDSALTLYLAGKTSDPAEFNHAIDILKNIVLQARQKYYNIPEGG